MTEEEHKVYQGEVVGPKGDSFDIDNQDDKYEGTPGLGMGLGAAGLGALALALMKGGNLGISDSQKANIRHLIAAAGAGASSKMLSKHVGTAISAGLGGFIAGLLADKVLPPQQAKNIEKILHDYGY